MKKGLIIKEHRFNVDNIFSYTHYINVYKEFVLTINSIETKNTIDIIFKKDNKEEFDNILKTLDDIFKINKKKLDT